MKTIKEIAEQLAKCNYSDDLGHPLENNIAFFRLSQLANINYQPKFALNEKVIYENEEVYVFAMRVSSSSHPEPEVEYLLSRKYNRQSTTNASYTSCWINESSIRSVKDHIDAEIEKAKNLLANNGFKVSR